MATLRCREPFFTRVNGVPRVVTGGQLVDSDDPVVKGRERFFEPVDDYMAKRSAVEQATAAPGEKRSRGRARKVNGKPKADETPEAGEAPSEGSED